jgi:hypothetical protein
VTSETLTCSVSCGIRSRRATTSFFIGLGVLYITRSSCSTLSWLT